MRSQDAEQVYAQLQRAEVEMRFAVADLAQMKALDDFPEIVVALRAVSVTLDRLKLVARDARDAENADPGQAARPSR